MTENRGSQEKDKFICENFDPPICWHESTGKNYMQTIACTCGSYAWKGEDFAEHQRENNPDFESEAGRVQLLKLIYSGVLNRYSFINDKDVWDLTYLMTNDKGLFRDEVFRWMGGVE